MEKNQGLSDYMNMASIQSVGITQMVWVIVAEVISCLMRQVRVASLQLFQHNHLQKKMRTLHCQV